MCHLLVAVSVLTCRLSDFHPVFFCVILFVVARASRLCQTHPTLRTIDMFTFRGPSQIGDRLLLKAIVNNAFTNRWPFARESPKMTGGLITVPSLSCVCCSIEVGVRAEAYHDQGTNRHINSAFMIFEVLDDQGKPCPLPGLRPEPLVSWPTRPNTFSSFSCGHKYENANHSKRKVK